MATYKEIQLYVKEKYDVNVKTCWIAHMKEKCGLPLRSASNRKCATSREFPCPADKESMIEDAFKHFKML